MSYRTFKRVLGETSLERKCRFLFGTTLLLLILSSFWWCSEETEQIVHDKPRSNSRHLVGSVLIKLHAEPLAPDETQRLQFQEMASDLEDLVYEGAVLALEDTDRKLVSLPNGIVETQKLVELKKKYTAQLASVRAQTSGPRLEAQSGGEPPVVSDAVADEQIYETYKEMPPVYEDRWLKKLEQYQYFQPVYWKASCIECHKHIHSEYLGKLPDNATAQQILEHMPFRVVKIVVPNAGTQRAINRIRAFLIAMGIVTVFLSMIALYIVVRYVIVKPLQHLRDVSEEVEHGNYAARAKIETSDEFEELAGSFNRMLRHLVDIQAELQTTNTKLDSKVDELAQANMQLYELNRVKSEFMASVSHELRTPLNSIIGFADLLNDIERLNAQEKKFVKNIGSSGRVLLELINDILDLAKMESGKMQVSPSEFDLRTVTRAQIDVVENLANEKNIDITFDCPESLPAIYQDQAKVQQILTNLLSNAIKFTPDGGMITVIVRPIGSVRTALQNLAITVQDTGIGIADEDYEVIFEKFRQATPRRGADNLTREFSGTGLGLSIIRELCKLLGGHISFTSQLGHGSAFTVTLPCDLSKASSLRTTLPTNGLDAAATGNSNQNGDSIQNAASANLDAPNADGS